jgi:HEAT repeat protein
MKTLQAIALILTLIGSQVSAHDLEAEASSPVWQVRYCVLNRFEVADATARRLLEKLCTDSHLGVANQAFAHYSSLFVSLDHQLVKAAFRRGDFNIDGVNVDDRYAFGQPSFWVEDLKETGAPDIQARAIRALGMCGTQEHVPLLLEYQKSDNPDLLYELAKALHRLGDEAGYLNVIESLLRLPPASAVYYQTLAIDCLLQTHPTQAREHWNKLHAAISALPDLQPNWMCAHILKENRLP